MDIVSRRTGSDCGESQRGRERQREGATQREGETQSGTERQKEGETKGRIDKERRRANGVVTVDCV